MCRPHAYKSGLSLAPATASCAPLGPVPSPLARLADGGADGSVAKEELERAVGDAPAKNMGQRAQRWGLLLPASH